MKKSSGMQKKLLMIIVGSVFLFSVVSAIAWGKIYTTQLTKMEVEYADEMLDIINNNTETYLSKLRLLAYVLQNNQTVINILDKTSYKSDSTQLSDMRVMQMILKASMTGTQYMQNINLYMEDGRCFSAGGSSEKLELVQVEKLIASSENEDVVYWVSQPESTNGYPKLYLCKELKLVGNPQKSYVVMTVNCKGLFHDYNQTMKYQSALLIWDSSQQQVVYSDNLSIFSVDAEDISNDILNGDLNKYQTFKINGEKTAVFAKTSKLTGWKNIVLIPYSQLKYHSEDILTHSAVFFVLILLAALFFGRIITKHFLKNIERLTEAMEEIDGDQCCMKIEIHSGDEVERLYRKFQEMMERINDQIMFIKNNERDKRKLALKVLQTQINPHFLYNSLNTIKCIAQMQGVDAIVDAANSLSAIMQVNMSKNSYLTFEEEIEYLKKYICLKEFQSATRIHFICKVEEDLKSCYIQKMLIQPLIENSLKHGEIMSKTNGYISLSVYAEDEKVVCVDVEDNGVGLSEEESREIMAHMKESQGIGLFNISQRILLNYGDEYGVSLSGEKGIYTRITLRIPRMMEVGADDD